MENLTEWGYVEREAEFLNAVSYCGSWFVASQYSRFLGGQRGAVMVQLVRKGKRQGHIREDWVSKNRVIYRWMGIPPEPAAKAAAKAAAAAKRRSLFTLEFVIDHWKKVQFYLCPDQKRGLLSSLGCVPSKAIPEEFGTEPIFRSNDAIGFCFVDEGQTFEAWFARRTALFSAIGKVIVVYVSAYKRHIEAARKHVAKWVASASDPAKKALFESFKSRVEDKQKRAPLTEGEARQYWQLREEFGRAEHRAQAGAEVAVLEWWEPGVNKYYKLLESPLLATSVKQG